MNAETFAKLIRRSESLGAPLLACFLGRVYKLMPSGEHEYFHFGQGTWLPI